MLCWLDSRSHLDHFLNFLFRIRFTFIRNLVIYKYARAIKDFVCIDFTYGIRMGGRSFVGMCSRQVVSEIVG